MSLFRDIKNGRFYLGDCLEVMKEIPDGAVDMILCDLPYGTTQNKWDSIISFDELWEQYLRIAKENAPIVLTAAQPFTTKLIASQLTLFSHIWYWKKGKPTGHLNAKKQPMREIEEVVIFAKGTPNYYPQGLIECNKTTKQGSRVTDNNGGGRRKTEYLQTHTNYPKTIQRFSSEGKTVHSTQKPVALMEYLIKTYTNEGETVLDFTMGSGTTGVACANTGRKFIGIELDLNYFNIALDRIEAAHGITK